MHSQGQLLSVRYRSFIGLLIRLTDRFFGGLTSLGRRNVDNVTVVFTRGRFRKLVLLSNILALFLIGGQIIVSLTLGLLDSSSCQH